MRFINFKSVEGKNFLSFGEKASKIDLKNGVNSIVGTNYDKEDSKNGAGKCLDKSTKIEIEIVDLMVQEKFLQFLKSRT